MIYMAWASLFIHTLSLGISLACVGKPKKNYAPLDVLVDFIFVILWGISLYFYTLK